MILCDFASAGTMTGSDHKEANRMAQSHACFTMKATHINCTERIEPEKAPEFKPVIIDGVA